MVPRRLELLGESAGHAHTHIRTRTHTHTHTHIQVESHERVMFCLQWPRCYQVANVCWFRYDTRH